MRKLTDSELDALWELIDTRGTCYPGMLVDAIREVYGEGVNRGGSFLVPDDAVAKFPETTEAGNAN